MGKTTEHCSRIDKVLTYDFLYRAVVVEGHTREEIARSTGFGRSTVQKRVISFGLRRKSRREDLTGRRFGMLVVLGRSDEGYRNNNIVYMCRCDCETIVHVLATNLHEKGGSRSCGCTRYGKGEASRCWKGCGELSGRYWSIIRTNAKTRDIEFDIEISYAWNLFLLQGRRCALTGWPIAFGTGTDQTASLDRIDSKRGYDEGNVQWLHKDVNIMKNEYPEDYFIRMCRSVADTRFQDHAK